MRTMKKNRQNVYIAPRFKQHNDKGTYDFEEPFLFRENLSPVNSESEVKEYGERHYNMYKSIVSRNKWENKINAEDRAYIDRTPDGEKVYGAKADYRVESVRKTLNTLTVYFEKI